MLSGWTSSIIRILQTRLDLTVRAVVCIPAEAAEHDSPPTLAQRSSHSLDQVRHNPDPPVRLFGKRRSFLQSSILQAHIVHPSRLARSELIHAAIVRVVHKVFDRVEPWLAQA